MIKKFPEFYREYSEEREKIRKILPPEKQLEFPSERPERKLGVPSEELLKLRESQEIQDQYLIESIRQKVKKRLGKEIKKKDVERLKELQELSEREKKELIIDLQTIILYEKGMADNDEYVRRGTAQSLGVLAEKYPEKAIPLYEKGMADNDEYVRRGTAQSLGALAEKYPDKFISLYEKSLTNSNPYVRQITARSLGALAEKYPEKALPLYEKGMADNDEYVRRGTAQSLGALAEKYPEKALPLYEKGMADNDKYVRWGTARSLGALAEKYPEKAIPLYEKGMTDDSKDVRWKTTESLRALAKDRSFKNENKISRILKDKYKIGVKESFYSYQVLINLLRQEEDLGQFVLKYLPEQRAIKEFSKEINSELTDDKKTEDIEKFWQKNQLSLANLQSFNLKLSTQVIRETLRLFGFPRLERFLKTADSVLADSEMKESLKNIIDKVKNINFELFSRLINLTDAFVRMNLKDDFKIQTETLSAKKELSGKEVIRQLGEKLLFKFAERLNIETETIRASIDQWNLEYMAKLFEAEKLFKEKSKNDYEFLKLIMKATFQEERFKDVLLGKYQGEYTEEEREWLEELTKYTEEVKREFQEKGIDFEKWYNYPETEDFQIGPPPEAQKKKREQFTRELYEVVINLLGNWREKKKGLLSKDKAKEVFDKVFKKYGIQFKEGEFYHPRKGKLNLRDINSVLADFNSLIEQFYQQETNEQIKEQIGTNLAHLQDLKARLPDLSKELSRRGYHLSIKPWQRTPGYDIFQGNYTHCCIAVENLNRGAILDYLTDAGMQIIEIRDEAEDKTIAQTFIYFTEDSQGNINMVLDNVEVNSDYSGLADEIKKHLFEYLKALSLEVCPKAKRILLGTAYNDIETSDLSQRNLSLRKIGGSPRANEYLDAFGSVWLDPSRETLKTLFLIAEDFRDKKERKEKKPSHRYITNQLKKWMRKP